MKRRFDFLKFNRPNKLTEPEIDLIRVKAIIPTLKINNLMMTK